MQGKMGIETRNIVYYIGFIRHSYGDEGDEIEE
jgi:hypothetical protein